MKMDRKEHLRTYKERTLIGGVCAIVNNANGKHLISAETDLEAYKNRFQFSMQMNMPMSMKYQRDWKLFGAESFELVVIEALEKKEDQTMEDYLTDLKVLEEMVNERFEKAQKY